MQLKILSPSIYHQLVPNSTRPIWHQWHINNEDKNNKENLEENNENINKRSSTARRRLFFEEGGEGNNKEINKVNLNLIKNCLKFSSKFSAICPKLVK